MRIPLPWTAGPARGMAAPPAHGAPPRPPLEPHVRAALPPDRNILHSRPLACAVIVVTGLILPYLVLLATWGWHAVFDADPRTAQRLWILLTPGGRQLFGAVWLALLQALPFLVLAAAAWGRLSPLNPWRRRTAWRIGGAFIGLCVGVVFTYGIVVPRMDDWRSPGLDTPLSLFAVLYSLCVFAVLIGRAIGRTLARRFGQPHL